jgi:hypothetical protein
MTIAMLAIVCVCVCLVVCLLCDKISEFRVSCVVTCHSRTDTISGCGFYKNQEGKLQLLACWPALPK